MSKISGTWTLNESDIDTVEDTCPKGMAAPVRTASWNPLLAGGASSARAGPDASANAHPNARDALKERRCGGLKRPQVYSAFPASGGGSCRERRSMESGDPSGAISVACGPQQGLASGEREEERRATAARLPQALVITSSSGETDTD
jgi:hypothetical protein